MSSWEMKAHLKLGDLSLDIDLSGGERPLALIGANGSGKTTILRMILGLLQPRDGFLRIGDQVFHDSAQGIHIPVEDRQLAYLPQGLGLFPHMTVAQNIAFVGGVEALTKESLEEGKYSAFIQELGVHHYLDRWPSQLSAGERQKVALARVLIQQPGMVLLDEPASALDILARREVRKILAKHLAELEIPTVLVTHDFRDVRELEADLAYLCDGRIQRVGSLDDFIGSSSGEFLSDDFLSEFLAQP